MQEKIDSGNHSPIYVSSSASFLFIAFLALKTQQGGMGKGSFHKSDESTKTEMD
jgi:hypothetical protein